MNIDLGEDAFDNVDVLREAAVAAVLDAHRSAMEAEPILEGDRQAWEWMAALYRNFYDEVEEVANDATVDQEALASALVVWLVMSAEGAHDVDVDGILAERGVRDVVALGLYALLLAENDKLMDRLAGGLRP